MSYIRRVRALVKAKQKLSERTNVPVEQMALRGPTTKRIRKLSRAVKRSRRQKKRLF